MNGFSIFKQKVRWYLYNLSQFAEFFDKEKKTTDEVLERKVKLIYDLESELRAYYKHVDNFGTHA